MKLFKLYASTGDGPVLFEEPDSFREAVKEAVDDIICGNTDSETLELGLVEMSEEEFYSLEVS